MEIILVVIGIRHDTLLDVLEDGRARFLGSFARQEGPFTQLLQILKGEAVDADQPE